MVASATIVGVVDLHALAQRHRDGAARRRPLRPPHRPAQPRLAAAALRRAEVSQAHATGGSIALIVYDLDCFKSVNDDLGHDRGDAVLRDTAHLLRRHLRAFDLVYRLGGEEFAVVLPGVGVAEAFEIAQRQRESIEEARPGGVPITISGGVASGARLRRRVGVAVPPRRHRAAAPPSARAATGSSSPRTRRRQSAPASRSIRARSSSPRPAETARPARSCVSAHAARRRVVEQLLALVVLAREPQEQPAEQADRQQRRLDVHDPAGDRLVGLGADVVRGLAGRVGGVEDRAEQQRVGEDRAEQPDADDVAGLPRRSRTRPAAAAARTGTSTCSR